MSRSTAFLRHRFALLPLVLALAWISGCGGKPGAKDNISGKVTIDDKPVAGEVTFISADGKEIKSPISAEGNYTVYGVPKGKADVLVKSLATMAPPTTKDGGGKDPGLAGTTGASAPAKYGQKGALTFDVTGGDQKWDIKLSN